MVIGKGYGKVILFGEHFVVYGLPGIASGIDKYIKVKINRIKEKDIVFYDKIFKEKRCMNSNPNHILCKLFDTMFHDLKLNSLKITISGDCIPKSGMGYSAALNVALARAVSSLLKLNWDDDIINEIAYKGETLVHGKPSGIDNTCATFGSLILFEKNTKGEKDKIISFKSANPLLLVLVDTKIKHDTKEAINIVKKRKLNNPKLFDKLFFDEKILIAKAKIAIEEGNLRNVGLLMNKNQELLRQIGVSSKELEILIKTALENGAYGAKLTGAGCGGLMIALCKSSKQQELIIKKYRKLGFDGTKIIIN